MAIEDLAQKIAQQKGVSSDEVEKQLESLGSELPEGQSVEDILRDMAPVTVLDEGARTRIRVRPTNADVLPASPVTREDHSNRINAQFIAGERMELWVVRAVWISALALFLSYL